MKALVRYLSLKSWRDGSAVSFALLPLLGPTMGLIGSTAAKGFRYPLFMSPQWSAVENATAAADMASIACVFFAVIPAFWMLRPEIASRSVGSIALATRPIVIVGSLIVFAATLQWTAWLLSLSLIASLTAALPAKLGILVLKVILHAIASAAFGALAVTISPQPAMIIGAYVAYVCAFARWIDNKNNVSELTTAVVIAVLSIVIATFLLERRCAR